MERTPPKTYRLKLEIIYEDEDLAIIIKPAGISVSGNQYKTIQNALMYNLTPSTKPDHLDWPLPVHRLDNQTAGLLLIAKTRTARIRLGQAFEQQKIDKVYHAVVIGEIPKSGIINLPIENKQAISQYKKLLDVPSLKNQTLSLIELYPKTGRTHQLRIHCALIDHPILGDKLYGKEGLILKAKGLFLSAVKLTFEHPISGLSQTFSIPTPKKFITRLMNEKRRFERFQDHKQI